ncbi:MAG TPA: paraquat-inducible protein A [Stellaceae bacterium]|nr:paraquat-inducible protein A [Stellaceae bacterium]
MTPPPPLGSRLRRTASRLKEALAPRRAARSYVLPPLTLVAAMAALIAGLSLPIMHVRWLGIFDHKISLLGGIAALYDDGEVVLAAILFAFSVAFPLAKIALLLAFWAARRAGRRPAAWLPALLQAIARWSMLDVFVLALAIFAIKAQPLADAQSAGAILPFVAAILLTSYGARLVERAGA